MIKIKVKVYKANDELNIQYIINSLVEDDYVEVGHPIHHDTVKLSLMIEKHEKNPQTWITELKNFFNVNDELSSDSIQINAIVIVETKLNIFLIPKGYAFHKILDLVDLDFGMDFAEREINPANISVKGVSFIQRNKKRGLTDYKENTTEFAQASESYFNISGTPDFEVGYGKNIDCGNAVSFQKSFPLKASNSEGRNESIDNFVRLFSNIEETMEKDPHSKFPRAVRIKDKEKQLILDNQLLETINNRENLYLSIDTNRIQLFDDNIQVVNNDYKFELYVVKEITDTIEEIELNNSSIVSYIQRHSKKIETIESLKFKISLPQFEGATPITKDFKQVVHCEIEWEETIYLLENGSWQYLNNSFVDLIDEKLDDMNGFVDYSPEFNELYTEIGETSEDIFIDEACNSLKYTKLHKRMINRNNIKVELADLYSKDNSELLAIKRGTDTSQSMYSLSQSILGIQVLKNHQSYYAKDELFKYNDRDKYNNHNYQLISEDTINDILKCKTYNILWLIKDEDANYVKRGVKSENFKLSQFGSIMLKLQIIDFYDFAKTHEFNSKIYFAITV